jgi:hypothetical protein
MPLHQRGSKEWNENVSRVAVENLTFYMHTSRTLTSDRQPAKEFSPAYLEHPIFRHFI